MTERRFVLALDQGTTSSRAILFDLGQTTLTLTVLYPLAVWHGNASPAARSSLTRLLSAPPLWALAIILALKVAGLHLPSWLRDVLMPVHLTTTPLASLVLGLSILCGGTKYNEQRFNRTGARTST